MYIITSMSPLLSYQTMSPLYKVLRFFDIFTFDKRELIDTLQNKKRAVVYQ